MNNELQNTQTSVAHGDDIDGITLAVILGALESTVRQMTITMERTSRSPIFNLAHDYSNAVFDWTPRMIVQGQDLPIHLGALIFATRSVVEHFDGDVQPGDVFYHNDPVTGGSHYQDMCMFRPVFFEDDLLFWVTNKAHMDDTGGGVAGGYNPLAEDIYSEGLRIPPLRLYDAGVPRQDVFQLIAENVRTRDQQRHDMAAQLASLTIAERSLLALADRYGAGILRRAIERILDIGEENMRSAIREMPDGNYDGLSLIEANGRTEELEIRCALHVQGETLSVALAAPSQVPKYINSYWGNTISAIYSAVLSYARVATPYNEGLYRPIEIDLGPPGSVVNASDPAPCGAATTTPGDNVTEAVRSALAQVLPNRAIGGWCHCAGTIQTGTNPRTGEFYNFNMIIGTSGGAGATWGLDGWHCLNSSCGSGAMLTGDLELLEHDYPIHIHRFELRPDSAGPGRWRGGLASVFEVEPIDHEAALVFFGEGHVYPAPGVLGATAGRVDEKVARKRIRDGHGVSVEHAANTMTTIRPGERLEASPPGGGGVGSPYERDVERVVSDVRNGLVSVRAAEEEYGVILREPGLTVDGPATDDLRRRRSGSDVNPDLPEVASHGSNW